MLNETPTLNDIFTWPSSPTGRTPSSGAKSLRSPVGLGQGSFRIYAQQATEGPVSYTRLATAILDQLGR